MPVVANVPADPSMLKVGTKVTVNTVNGANGLICRPHLNLPVIKEIFIPHVDPRRLRWSDGGKKAPSVTLVRLSPIYWPE